MKHAGIWMMVGLGLGISSLVACSADSTSTSNETDSGAGDDDAGAVVESDAGAHDGATDAAHGDAGGGDSATTPSKVTLAVAQGSYKNTTAAGGGYVYAIKFKVNNTSSFDVVSLDTMTFDFGAGKTVSLTEPLCAGSFPIAAGSSALVDTQVLISTGGSVTNFAVICGASQDFGGASGTAPATSTFSSSIGITVGGKTSDGTFAASGSAS